MAADTLDIQASARGRLRETIAMFGDAAVAAETSASLAQLRRWLACHDPVPQRVIRWLDGLGDLTTQTASTETKPKLARNRDYPHLGNRLQGDLCAAIREHGLATVAKQCGAMPQAVRRWASGGSLRQSSKDAVAAYLRTWRTELTAPKPTAPPERRQDASPFAVLAGLAPQDRAIAAKEFGRALAEMHFQGRKQ